jgi:glycosyltransferase involved in cell wall biosynthesis
MEVDVAAVGRDPQFGDGGRAQIEAFLRGSGTLGRTSQLVYDVHPGVRGGTISWRRLEALRARTAPRRVHVPPSRSLWVVSTHASDGYPALSSGRPFSCWVGTTVESEWRGRSGAMGRLHRAAASLSMPTLRNLERHVLDRATSVYATSSASRDDVAAAGNRADVGILPIPIDLDHFAPAPDAEWRCTLDNPMMIFVGRSDDPRKNITLLLEVARLLPDVRFVLAGAPPVGGVPPNVTVLGRVVDVAAVLRSGSIFALPSRQEGFGIVVAEALACGLPVITTPSGGPEGLVRDSEGGRVTESFDPGEFASVARSLLERPDDLSQMRKLGRAFVERVHSPAAFRHALAGAFAKDST